MGKETAAFKKNGKAESPAKQRKKPEDLIPFDEKDFKEF